jgi:hypothetical protein
VDIDIDAARVTQVFWGGKASAPKGAVLDLEYHSRDLPNFPSRLSYTDAVSGFKVKIDFDRVLIEESGRPR